MVFRIGSRVPSFDAVTLSVKPAFEESHEDSFQAMKKLFEKVLDAFYAICRSLNIVFKFWFRFVKQDGHPHIHGILFADCKRARRELARLWSKMGLGFMEFRERRKRGNCCFKAIYDLGGWLMGYMYCKKNKFGSDMKRRCSYHGGSILRKLAPLDLYQKFLSDGFPIFLKSLRHDI